jgi:hypothetical protein
VGLTDEEMIDWYHKRMPVGKDFGDWDWCDTGGSIAGGTYALIYSQGPKKILAVAFAPADPPDRQRCSSGGIGLDPAERDFLVAARAVAVTVKAERI